MNNLKRLNPYFLAAGVLGLAVCAPGLLHRDSVALQGYLIGFLFWSGLSLGSLGILMINHAAGGRWGIVIRRPLESAASLLPLCAVLFLPLLFGAGSLYEWTHAAGDEHIQKISAYLNLPFFTIRAALYFVIWSGLARSLRRNSLRQDDGADVGAKLNAVSAPGILILVLTTTFAYTDWVMSLEPHWFSTIYGSLVLTGHAAGALAGAILVAGLLRNESDVRPVANPNRFQQLGNLLFAFIMFWAYLSFSQYLLIWSANLAEEVPWIIRRTSNGWGWLALGVVACHFAAPFFVLLFRKVKRRAESLMAVAAGFLVARWFDVVWLVAPALRSGHFHIALTDLAATIGIGGLWLWFFVNGLAARRLAPVGDPRFAEASS